MCMFFFLLVFFLGFVFSLARASFAKPQPCKEEIHGTSQPRPGTQSHPPSQRNIDSEMARDKCTSMMEQHSLRDIYEHPRWESHLFIPTFRSWDKHKAGTIEVRTKDAVPTRSARNYEQEPSPREMGKLESHLFLPSTALGDEHAPLTSPKST